MWSMMKHWERLAQPDVRQARIFIMKFCIWEKRRPDAVLES